VRRTAIEVAGTGFTVLDRIYADDQSSFEALGGSCGNVLISLALLNYRVAPVLSLGLDAAGDTLLTELEEAGVDLQYIFRSGHVASPILAQLVDTILGQHRFSFVCPDTEEDLPGFTSIEALEVHLAASVLHDCSVFYTDRLSRAILDAMEMADGAGALVYFEPSVFDDHDLFHRALQHTSILKYSSERFSQSIGEEHLQRGAISIITHGADGLEVRQNARFFQCKAARASAVRDTSGSGDMVSVGIIDHVLSLGRGAQALQSIEDIIAGVTAGQRLAAANCAFTGARGLFRHCGAEIARAILKGENPALDNEAAYSAAIKSGQSAPAAPHRSASRSSINIKPSMLLPTPLTSPQRRLTGLSTVADSTRRASPVKRRSSRRSSCCVNFAQSTLLILSNLDRDHPGAISQ